MLRKTSSLMWAESAEFITDEFFRENPCQLKEKEDL
jgi:hypothetical protein